MVPELVSLTYKPHRGQIIVYVGERLLGRVVTSADGKVLIEPYTKIIEWVA